MADNFIQPPPALKLDGNIAENWRRWKTKAKLYMEAIGAAAKPAAQQAAIFLHIIGDEALDVYNGFTFGASEDKRDLKTLKAKFKAYCIPKQNITFERYKFFKRNQREAEPIDSYVTDLRCLAKTCEFATLHDGLVRDRIVCGITSDTVRERLLRESDLTLAKCIDFCRAAEISKEQVKEIRDTGDGAGNGEKAVHVLKAGRGRPPQFPSKTGSRDQFYDNPGPRANRGMRTCKYCGKQHPPRRCSAYGKRCTRCNKWNHDSSVCRSNPVHTIEAQEYEAEQFQDWEGSEQYYQEQETTQPGRDLFLGELLMASLQDTDDKWQASIPIEGKYIKFKLDTGAQANVLPHKLYDKLFSKTKLQNTQAILTAFGNKHIKPRGKVSLACKLANKHHTLDFYVTEAAGIPILGHKACEQLNLVERVNINSITTPEPLTKQNLMCQYAEVFTGYGQFEKEYHIELAEGAVPVIQPPRKIPFSRMEKLKDTLANMEKNGIIAPVDQPTDWVVIVEKRNRDLRLCLDARPLNDAIRREHFNIPTPDQVQSQLNGATMFTIFDEKDSFWQVRLTDDSSYLCTFNTPWGRKRFLRMPFGISSASEVLQKRNMDTFGDIQGLHIIADDMIIAAENEKIHDEILHKVLQRARAKNIKFNQAKIQLKVNEVKYMGHIVSDKGLRPDPKKIEAINQMPVPEDKHGLQRLLGMVKYLSQYIPNESDITAPLRELLKQDHVWAWQPEHDRALQQIKDILTAHPVLHYFCIGKPVKIQADASQTGLGACLIQDGHPVAYASRTLTSAERNYAQIEKEALAILFACEKFHQYVYGLPWPVEIESDHRPLETILRKPLAQASPRLQRLMLRLQRYQIHVKYVPGKHLQLADTLSRASLAEQPQKDILDDVELMVHALVENLNISPCGLADMQAATSEDTILQTLVRYIQGGWPEARHHVPAEIRPYWSCRDGLHIAENLVFLGERLVIPPTIRKKCSNSPTKVTWAWTNAKKGLEWSCIGQT